MFLYLRDVRAENGTERVPYFVSRWREVFYVVFGNDTWGGIKTGKEGEVGGKQSYRGDGRTEMDIKYDEKKGRR